MKLWRFALPLLLLIFAVQLESAHPNHKEKVWIIFVPRLSNNAKATQGFTARAILRRLRRGEGRLEESDRPVQREFVRAVKNAGATILVESRWLHAVSARCDSPCIRKLQKLDFVKGIRPVLTFRRPLDPIRPYPERALPSGRRLQYGESNDQLSQIGVPIVHGKGFAGQGEIVAIFDSGFRKDHIAFKNKTVLAERDFVLDDNNVSNGVSVDSHGTGTWSCVGGEVPGELYRPAYRAQFLLAATEDVASESVVEEDNWVAALEWADQLGATVISSSLGYSDWYSPLDFDGSTAITSRIAATAARKGIVVVNSIGNEGPDSSTLAPPADSKNILSVGAVDLNGTLANFSSRGPTADGRIKPEVVALGVETFIATSDSPKSFGRSNGTSFACPLIAGAAATLLSVHPDWTPLQVREALMNTARNAASPDNNYGWGIIHLFNATEFLPKKSIVIDQHKPLKNTSNHDRPYRVDVRIRAQRGLNREQLFLFWKKERTGTYNQEKLTPTVNEDFYEGLIPPQSGGSTVVYYFTARDRKGKINRLPLDAPASAFRFRVI